MSTEMSLKGDIKINVLGTGPPFNGGYCYSLLSCNLLITIALVSSDRAEVTSMPAEEEGQTNTQTTCPFTHECPE